MTYDPNSTPVGAPLPLADSITRFLGNDQLEDTWLNTNGTYQPRGAANLRPVETVPALMTRIGNQVASFVATAQAAASSAGVLVYQTKAALNAALPSLANGQVVEAIDETNGYLRTRWVVQSNALSNPRIIDASIAQQAAYARPTLPTFLNARGMFSALASYTNASGVADAVVSPSTGLLYSLKVAGTAQYTTDPANDSADWQLEQTALLSSLALNTIGFGADLLANAVRRVGSVAELLTLKKGAIKRTITLDSYYGNGQGGGDVLTYDPADTATVADNGTIFIATDGGVYRRPRKSIQTAADWGVKGDGSNEAVRLQALLNYIGANGGGASFGNMMPCSGSTLTLVVTKPTFISGNHRNLSGIKFTADADGLSVNVSAGQPFYTAGFNYCPAFVPAGSTVNNTSAASRGLRVFNSSGSPVYDCFASFQIGFGLLAGTTCNWFQDCVVSNIALAKMIEPLSVGYQNGTAYSTTGTAYRFEATATAAVDCLIDKPIVIAKAIAVDRYSSVAPGLEGLIVSLPKFIGVGIGDRGVNTLLAQGYLPPGHTTDGGHTNCNQAAVDWTGFQAPMITGFPVLYNAGTTSSPATAASVAHVILRGCQGGTVGFNTYNVSGGDAAPLLFDSTPGVCAHTSLDPASFFDQSGKSTITVQSVGTNLFNLGLESFRRIGGGEPYDAGVIGSSTNTTALTNRLGKVSNARRRFYFNLPAGSSVLDLSTVYEGMLGDTAEVELDTPNGAATITNILSRGQGQRVELLFNTSAQVTVQRQANVLLYGGANVAPTSGSYMGLKRGPSEWREDVGRAIA